MIVRIGTPSGRIVIPEAKVERFISLESGLPSSMVRITYKGKNYEELAKAFVEETSLSFECDTLKTKVTINGMSMQGEDTVEYVLQERSSEVPCRYKIISFEHKFANERAILVPEDVRDIPRSQTDMLRNLPFIRLILREDVPKGYLLPYPRYPE